MAASASNSPRSACGSRQASRLAAAAIIAASILLSLAWVLSQLPRLPLTSDLSTDFTVGANPGQFAYGLAPPLIFGPALAAAVALHLLARRFLAARRLINRAVDCAVQLGQPPRTHIQAVIRLTAWPAALAVAAAALEVPQWILPGAVVGTLLGAAHLLVVRWLRGA